MLSLDVCLLHLLEIAACSVVVKILGAHREQYLFCSKKSSIVALSTNDTRSNSMNRGVEIQQLPDGMTPHTDDSSKFGYPDGVDHNTKVDVVISHAGRMFLYTSEAQSFGWQIEAHAPSCPGLTSCSAPITHYAIRSAA